MIWHPRPPTLAAIRKERARERREHRFPWTTPDGFRQLVQAMPEALHDIEWAESIEPPRSPQAFAAELIFVICNSGMKNTVARQIYHRVMSLLWVGSSAGDGFKHKGKSTAIDVIWINRESLYRDYLLAGDEAAKLEFLAKLPWIGPVTKYHAAKNFGMNCVKPDVHLMRLANHAGTSPDALCARLAAATGYRVATVDTLLWRLCATGLIDSVSGRTRERATSSTQHSREKNAAA